MALSAEDLHFIERLIDERVGDIRVQRADFDRLEAAVARNTEGQTRLEAAVARLTEGHAQLEAASTRLTDGQAKLFEGQTKLFEGQTKLFEGQAKLEAAVARLVEGQVALRTEVGTLSERVGMGLEELAALFLPSLLEKRLGLRVFDLTRAFLPPGDPNPEEIDLLGTAIREGETVSVVVECKGRLHPGDVNAFLRKLERITPSLPHRAFPVMVGYVVHPSAQRVSSDVHFVTSHQLGT